MSIDKSKIIGQTWDSIQPLLTDIGEAGHYGGSDGYLCDWLEATLGGVRVRIDLIVPRDATGEDMEWDCTPWLVSGIEEVSV